jgi:hypothetical protein
MSLARFAVGRTLMHIGLRIMPRGRSRHELTILLQHWAARVRSELRSAA